MIFSHRTALSERTGCQANPCDRSGPLRILERGQTGRASAPAVPKPDGSDAFPAVGADRQWEEGEAERSNLGDNPRGNEPSWC